MSEEPMDITGETSDGYHTFNELYAYRKAYNALLFNEWAARGVYGVHKSWRHSDGELCFGGGWFIVSAQTPTGQITNHYKTDDWPLFQCEERPLATEWDGHTPAIALQRLLDLAAIPEQPVDLLALLHAQEEDNAALKRQLDARGQGNTMRATGSNAATD